jgi:hypothetical protein
MGTDAIAPARMPYELRRAGCTVALLAPRNALAAHTEFVDTIGFFPAEVTLFEWIQMLASGLREVGPALILPGDEVALRTLMQLALDPPRGLQRKMRDEISGAVRRSLGDVDGWLDSIDKARLFTLAERGGRGHGSGRCCG